MKSLIPCILFFCSLWVVVLPADAQWGDLKFTFQYDGEAPARKQLVVDKDPEVCGKHKLFDETVIVNEKNHGIANITVYLLPRPDGAPPVHPQLQKNAQQPVTLDNIKCRFEPHVVLVQTGQPVILKNSDPVGHNTKVDTFANPAINPIIPGNSQLQTKFSEVERLPMPISCSIHRWMNARILIQDHPYMAVSDKDGKLTLKNVPAGEWTFQIYHEKPGYIQEVMIDGRKTRWRRGRVDITIQPGKVTDMGTVTIAPDVFED